jgi:hypothetical protein
MQSLRNIIYICTLKNVLQFKKNNDNAYDKCKIHKNKRSGYY